MDLTTEAIEIVRGAMHPEGFNVGVNLGSAAGAGIPGPRPRSCSPALGWGHQLHAGGGGDQGAA